MIAAQKNKNSMAKKNTAGKSDRKKTGSVAKAVDAASEQNSVLNSTLQQIEKQFGQGAIMPLGSDQDRRIEGISTGSLSLDLALGGHSSHFEA